MTCIVNNSQLTGGQVTFAGTSSILSHYLLEFTVIREYSAYKGFLIYYFVYVMPKPRRKFTLELLQEALSRDGAELIEVPGKFSSMAVAKYTCRCGSEGSRRVDVCVDFGAFCEPCAKETRAARRLATMALDSSITSDTKYFYLTTERDGECTKHHEDDVINLALNIRDRKPRIVRVKQNYIKVIWWNMELHREVAKWISSSKPDYMIKATELMQSKLTVPDDYRVPFCVRDISENLRRIKYHFRIPAQISDFPSEIVSLDPYILGTWLGDGHCKSTRITNVDANILAAWRSFANERGLQFLQHKDPRAKSQKLWPWAVTNAIADRLKGNPLREALRSLGVFEIKRIPDIYKQNSTDVRMQILAGLLDTDGSLDGVSYEFSQSLFHEPLFDDFREVAQSLGFRMSKAHATKICRYRGEIKECPAVRGILYGDARLADIPLKVEYKKIKKRKCARQDLYRFDLASVSNV